jgi:hypothetical protein
MFPVRIAGVTGLRASRFPAFEQLDRSGGYVPLRTAMPERWSRLLL